MKRRFSGEQIARIVHKAVESQDEQDSCKRHNISEQMFYRWCDKFGGMVVVNARRLKNLESENVWLKRLIAELMLVIDGLKKLGRKNLAFQRAGSKLWKS